MTRLKPRTVAVALSATLMVGGAALAITPAQATTASGSVKYLMPGAAHHTTTDCSDVTVEVYSGGVNRWIPICGITTLQSGPYNPINTVHPITLNRIWFHQNTDGSGWSKCFDLSQGHYINVPRGYKNPGNIQVTDNTNAC